MELVWIALSGIAGWLGASILEYAKTKGKNLADKEDVAAITKAVEDVKRENMVLIEDLRGTMQLRLAAAEKRIQAHQEAFAIWRSMLKVLYEGDHRTQVIAAQEWWERNCLYMTAEARDAFNLAYTSVGAIRMNSKNPSNYEVGDMWLNKFMRAGDVLVEGVALPSLGGRERETVKDV